MNELKSLGRYRIQGVLGQGAMGLVYDGLDPGLDRRVAIKTILTRKLDAEAARMVAVRFEREVFGRLSPWRRCPTTRHGAPSSTAAGCMRP